jgi:hypothetical protein
MHRLGFNGAEGGVGTEACYAFFISIPQQQRGGASPPPPAFAPCVTFTSHPQFGFGQRYVSPAVIAIIHLLIDRWAVCLDGHMLRLVGGDARASARLFAPGIHPFDPGVSRIARVPREEEEIVD